MKTVKAVIFDVYHTLLEVAPGPRGAEKRWSRLWRNSLGTAPEISLAEFNLSCRNTVTEDHAGRKTEGVAWPEVDWRCVAVRAADGLSGLGGERLDVFLFGHAKLQRSTRATPGAAAFLTKIRERGLLTGIASNAQRYTIDELSAAGIPAAGFERDLSFWSFEAGFSKPDPAVFARLTEQLAKRGMTPDETLMIGDRLDNDMEPARAAGWQTWHFTGKWPQL